MSPPPPAPAQFQEGTNPANLSSAHETLLEKLIRTPEAGFLRRLRSDRTRFLLYSKNELGPTYIVLRTGFRSSKDIKKNKKTEESQYPPTLQMPGTILKWKAGLFISFPPVCLWACTPSILSRSRLMQIILTVTKLDSLFFFFFNLTLT